MRKRITIALFVVLMAAFVVINHRSRPVVSTEVGASVVESATTTLVAVASSTDDSIYTHATVQIAGKTFDALISDTEALQEKGLGDRNGLLPGQVMLFSFNKADLYGFWMKDMRFSIDILWLDSSNHVVWMEKDLSPTTYPKAYFPPKPALHVVELASGTLETLHVGLGDLVNIF